MSAAIAENKEKKKFWTMKRKRLCFIWGMLALPLLQWLVFFVYVNLDSIAMSFQQIDYASGKVVWTIDNYARFGREFKLLPQMRNAIKNSVFAGLNDALLAMISVMLAYIFYKKVPGREFFRIVFFLPSIISIVVYTMAYKYMFANGGPINSLLQKAGMRLSDIPLWFGDKHWAFRLVLIYCLWVGTGYNVLILGGAIENLPEEVMEYSKIEGVGMLRELFQIVIPMIWPTLAVSFLGCITTVFTMFIQVDLLTEGGPDQSSQTIAYLINGLIKSSNANLEWGACMGICFTVIATPFIVVARKLLDKTSEKFGF